MSHAKTIRSQWVSCNSLQISAQATPGKVLTCDDITGKGSWQTAGGGSGMTTSMNNALAALTVAHNTTTVLTTRNFVINTTNDNENLTFNCIGTGGTGSLNLTTSSGNVNIACNSFFSNSIGVHVVGGGVFDVKMSTVGDVLFSIKAGPDYVEIPALSGLKIASGSPGLNKVLTSDATGVCSWQTPAASGMNVAMSNATGAAVVTAAILPTHHWVVNINGTSYKLLLAL